MPNVVTLTFNPCIDKNIGVAKLIPEQKLRCQNAQITPGGGGINVARVLNRLGQPATAIYPAGGHVGEMLSGLLRLEQVDTIPVPIENETRENWIVDEDSTGHQYRFIMPGPALNSSAFELCLSKLQSLQDIEFIVVSGSMTAGVPQNVFERIAVIAKSKNAKLIVDSSGDPLIEAVKQGVYLIKPSLSELSSLIAAFNLDTECPATACRQLITMGYCKAIVVSLGAGGAILVTSQISVEYAAPAIPKRSSSGAGDSLVAGIIYRLMRGYNLEDAVQFGIACGSAAASHSGTAAFSFEEAEALYQKMMTKSC